MILPVNLFLNFELILNDVPHLCQWLLIRRSFLLLLAVLQAIYPESAVPKPAAKSVLLQRLQPFALANILDQWAHRSFHIGQSLRP